MIRKLKKEQHQDKKKRILICIYVVHSYAYFVANVAKGMKNCVRSDNLLFLSLNVL